MRLSAIMKKIAKKALLLVAAIIIVAAAYSVISGTSNIPEGSLSVKAQAVLNESGCVLCHTKNPQLPFYAKIPLLNAPIVSDISRGLKCFDMTADVENIKANKPLNATSLSKIEYAFDSGTMPPMLFKVVHWKSQPTSAERAVIKAWIAQQRKIRNAHSAVAEKFVNEPVWPIPQTVKTDPRKVELGKILYHSTALSGDGTVSCATCHPIDKAGVDGLRTSKGIRGQYGAINAPTVINAVFNARQFWNGRAANLEEQAGGPPMNPVEMDGGSWDAIAKRLEKDAKLSAAFKAVYPKGFTQENITDAIAEYEKTLITPDSPFDRYLRGDENAISPQAKAGYEAFKAYNCHVCHAGQNFGGQTFEYMGLRADYFNKRKDVGNIDDSGLVSFTKDERDTHKFKTPTLRNVELTAPYFHDGSTSDLSEAVKIMAEVQTGKVPSDTDVKNLVEFLKSLTGKLPQAK